MLAPALRAALPPDIPPLHSIEQHGEFIDCLVKYGLGSEPEYDINDPQYTQLSNLLVKHHMQMLFDAADKDGRFYEVLRNHDIAIANVSWQWQQIAQACG